MTISGRRCDRRKPQLHPVRILERKRQEALIATESAARQKLEQVAADEERTARHSPRMRQTCRLPNWPADKLIWRARVHLASSQSELEAQRRQRAALDSQELLLRADLAGKKASLTLAQTNLGYTRITAPEDGVVSERKVRAAQMVSPGTQVISLVQKVLVDAAGLEPATTCLEERVVTSKGSIVYA